MRTTGHARERQRRSLGAALLHIGYTIFMCMAAPVYLLRTLWRALRQPRTLRHFRERIGLGEVEQSSPIWIHAVSVGEVAAAAPLLRRLHHLGIAPLLLTTTTVTGREHAQRLVGDISALRYLPLDLPFVVGGLLDRLQPRLLVLMETELWPNLVDACHLRDVPVVLVNGRLSARSASGYRKVRPLIRALLEGLTWLAAQTEDDANRFRELGMPTNRMSVTGSMKFDVMLPAHAGDELKARRVAFAGTRPVWIAASTGDGEEEVVLDAFQVVREAVPDVLLVLAPRHPHRADEIARLCCRRGVTVRRRTEALDGPATGIAAAVYLLDTLGELMDVYALADVAFVGGSLNGSGGHNVLEPAALSVPVLVGPDTHNFEEITQALVEAKGAYRVHNATEMGEVVAAMLQDHERRHRDGAAARAFFAARGGATERVAMALVGLLATKPARAP